MVRWFVCPTVSMVTTGHATGLEKTLFESAVSTGDNKHSWLTLSTRWRDWQKGIFVECD